MLLSLVGRDSFMAVKSVVIAADEVWASDMGTDTSVLAEVEATSQTGST